MEVEMHELSCSMLSYANNSTARQLSPKSYRILEDDATTALLLLDTRLAHADPIHLAPAANHLQMHGRVRPGPGGHSTPTTPLPSDTPGGRVGRGRPFEGGAQGWGDVTHYLAVYI